jgi:hypothetical protein
MILARIKMLFTEKFIMKKLLLFLFIGFTALSFGPKVDSDGIVKALKAGNVEQLATFFDSFIDLKLPEKEEIKNVGTKQATIALKAFFADNGIKGFDLTSQREMGNTMYMAGKLKNNGKGFNITIMMKKSEDNHGIVSIRIN